MNSTKNITTIHEEKDESKTSTQGGRLEKSPIYYSDYLQLSSILNAQHLESEKNGRPVHEEMLFIIVHQTYELWFKQILWELNSVITLMNRERIPERDISVVLSRLLRVIEIEKLLIAQFPVLETITPLDFMDFRDFLFPASGFQSFQFRLLENKLGIKTQQRVLHANQPYHYVLSEEHKRLVLQSENEPNLFKVVENWLERTPFMRDPASQFDFVRHHQAAVERMFDEDRRVILAMTGGDSPEAQEEQAKSLEELDRNRANFRALLNEDIHNQQVEAGTRRLSFRATQAALLIFLYHSEPVLHLPFLVLQALIEIDLLLSTWRSRHALMTHRMIGTKLGTGGSSGYWYLKATVERGRIFADISNLATYLIPRKDILPLPENIRKQLGFIMESEK